MLNDEEKLEIKILFESIEYFDRQRWQAFNKISELQRRCEHDWVIEKRWDESTFPGMPYMTSMIKKRCSRCESVTVHVDWDKQLIRYIEDTPD